MCIVVFKKIGNNNYIAKNRDKFVSPNISIIHELIDNIEVVYMYDMDTYWVEGMNEFGIGTLNSTLHVITDENIDKSEYNKTLYNLKRLMLKHNNLEKLASDWISFSQNKDLFRHGHTLLSDKHKCIHIESFDGEIPIRKNIYNNVVFTNHGISLTNAGYTNGIKYMSSLLRKDLAYNEIIKVKHKNDILKSLNKNYIDLNPEFHTYRNKKYTQLYLNLDYMHKTLSTTSQTLLCLSELIFYFNYDNENCNFVKYDNRLPMNYKPKIKVFINKISKSKKIEKMPFDKSHINNLTEKYMFKTKNILLYCIFLIMVICVFLIFVNQ